jgi:hypothetical protein
MPETATWVILGLLVLSFYQYSSPEQSHNLLEPIWGNVKDFIDTNNPMGSKNTTTTTEDTLCTQENNPVCGNGVTYQNNCFAGKAGIISVTAGAC